MSWSTSELRVRLAPLNRCKPSSKIFYWLVQGGTSFVYLLFFCSVLCLLCLCARLIICALLSPAGKGLTSWLSFVVPNCEFVTFPLVSWVWFLIVSIPDLCTLTYFNSNVQLLVECNFSTFMQSQIFTQMAMLIVTKPSLSEWGLGL